MRGLVAGVGLELHAPLRLVRDRIRYQDFERQPYTPPLPDFHHRNETLVRVGDPWLALILGSSSGALSWGARTGVSMPLGRTEENPFELGHHGLPHQHIQFGTGTWDPVFTGFAASRFGALTLQAQANVRLALAQNRHGYRAGDRYSVSMLVARDWSAGSRTLGWEAGRRRQPRAD
jgi:hypothetical protein